MLFSFGSGRFGLGNAAYLHFKNISLKELPLCSAPCPSPLSRLVDTASKMQFFTQHWMCGVVDYTGNLFLVKTEDGWYIFVSCILWNTAQLGNSPPVKAFSAFDGKFSPKIPQGQGGHSCRVKACSPFLKRRIDVASLSRLATTVTRHCQKTNGMRWMIDSLSLISSSSSPNSQTITGCCGYLL